MPILSATGKETLDRLITRAAEEKKVPNFVFGATNLDDELYFRGSGTHVFDDPASGELTPDSIFWICSQTKFIAAIAVLQLVEQGKVSLDTPVSDYLPHFKNVGVVTSAQKPDLKATETDVTLMHVLNHSSGLFYGLEMPNPIYLLPTPYSSSQDGEDATDRFLDKIKEGWNGIPLAFEPGTNFIYGWNSDIVGFIVEKVSGQSLEEYCKKNIFEPLGMKTSFYLTPELKEHLVALSLREADGELIRFVNQTPLIERDPSKVRVHLGGIGLYSSLRDYLTLLRHLLQVQAGRPVSVNSILKAATINTLFEPTLTEEGSKSVSALIVLPDVSWSTGCAVTTADWPGKRKKGSGFWSGWACTYHFLDPTTGVAAVFGTQLCGPFDAETFKLYNEFEEALYAGLESS